MAMGTSEVRFYGLSGPGVNLASGAKETLPRILGPDLPFG